MKRSLGRLATPEDCVNLVVFLCSDRACHITGEVIRVDGGQYIVIPCGSWIPWGGAR